VVALLGISAKIASAASSGAADKLIREGLELRRLGNDDAALGKFQNAFALEPTPKHTAQLGLCEQALGRWAEAERHLSDAIGKRSDPWVSKYLSILRESLEAAKANVGRLEFVGGPAGASLTVNGVVVGTLPLAEPVKVSAGQVYLEATAAGFSPWSTSIPLAGGHFQRIVVKMTVLTLEAKPATKVAPSSVLFVPDVTPAVSTPSSSVEPLAVPSTSVFSTWWFWTGAAALVAGAVVTAVLVSSGNGSSPSCPVGADACALQGK